MVDTMNVYIYPNNSSDNEAASDAKSVIEDAAQATKRHFRESDETVYYNVEMDTSHPSLSEEDWPGIASKKQGVQGGFKAWLNANNEKKGIGVYLLIVSSWGGGLAGELLGGAWENTPAAVAGYDAPSYNASTYDSAPIRDKERFRNICLQEVFHTFINNPDTLVDKEDNEHALGKVAATPTGAKQTPMVSSYVGTGLAKKGKCSRFAKDAGYTTEFTQCTLDATLDTYRNQK